MMLRMEAGTYITFGRGDKRAGMLLDAQTVNLIVEALRATTIKGAMATGGGTTGRTPEGTAQADKIFRIVKLLEEKKD